MEPPKKDEFARAAGAAGLESRETGAVPQAEESSVPGDAAPTITGPPPVDSPNREWVFLAGEVIGERYRIERALQRGGMGEVYLAYDMKLRQQIALKTILTKFTGNPRALERFRREIVTARAVAHPNVCRVFDLGEARIRNTVFPVQFLTMEYLPGDTLSERLRRKGKLSVEEALPVIRQIVLGMDAAHRAGIIHRDLKPSNVILTKDNEGVERAVVTDFGLARPVVRDDSLSGVGNVVGTINYMAPEQWRGEDTTPASDIFALGVVMHELVTGKRPAQSAGEEGLNAQWAQVIRKCLSPEPKERPQRALDVLKELERKPMGWLTRVGALLAALALLAAAIAGIFGGSLFRPGPTGPKRVAVLPFHADDEQLRPFADGLMEAITQRLAQYEGPNEELLITPASETLRSKVTSSSEARTKLGANLAIEGSLQSEQGRLRLVLAVVDTEKMKQLETTIVEGTRLRALAVQDRAVGQLADALRLRARPGLTGELATIAPGAHELYLSARGYLRRNDLLPNVRQAVGLLRKAVEMDPKNARLHAGLSEAIWREYERTSNRELVDPALRECREALGLNDRLAEVNISCGQVMAGTGKAKDALRHFEKALTVEPRNGEAMEGLGRAHEKLGDLGKAEAAFRDMVHLRSGDWQAYKQLGLYYYRDGRFEDAAAQFRRVIELTPDNASAYSSLGAMLAKSGKLDEARMALEKSVKIEPRHSNLTNLGWMLLDEGKYTEAATYFLRAAEDRPESHVLWGNLAAAYDLGKDGRAIQTYQRAIELAKKDLKVNPSDSALHVSLAHYYAFSGNKPAAEEWFAKALRAAPLTSKLMSFNAMTATALGKEKLARELLDKALKAGYSRREAAASPHLKNLLDSPHP